jgi:hypothetical protein
MGRMSKIRLKSGQFVRRKNRPEREQRSESDYEKRLDEGSCKHFGQCAGRTRT